MNLHVAKFPTIAVFLAVIVLPGCQSLTPRNDAATKNKNVEIEQLARMMTGNFSSSAQALLDPENYYDIRLYVARIWLERDDGPWLYVEQAAANRLDQPYRQRVYRLIEISRGSLASEIYELPAPATQFAGAWKNVAKLDAVTPAQLSLREGCIVYLNKQPDETFAGSTRGVGCESRLAGAQYATSEVVVLPDALQSWDRGYDANHQQVWGATEGPYYFLRDKPDTERDSQNPTGPDDTTRDDA